MVFGPVKHETNIRYQNMDDFENYISAKDIDYDSVDVILSGYVYKLYTPQFNVAKRSTYAKGTIYMQKIVKHPGQN